MSVVIDLNSEQFNICSTLISGEKLFAGFLGLREHSSTNYFTAILHIQFDA
jgi:hypothetical protein